MVASYYVGALNQTRFSASVLNHSGISSNSNMSGGEDLKEYGLWLISAKNINAVHGFSEHRGYMKLQALGKHLKSHNKSKGLAVSELINTSYIELEIAIC